MRQPHAETAPHCATHRPGRRSGSLLVLCVTLLLGLLLASSAQAEYGVVGHYEVNSNKQGNDVAVNGTGAGPADPGDFYTANAVGFSFSEGTVDRYDAEGNLVQSWGTDVVQSGPGQANERQSVAIFATGGTFELTFGGESTDPIAFDADASAVESELNALASIGGVGAAVSVSGGPGNETGSSPYLVTFTGAQGGAPQPLIQVGDSGLTGAGATSVVASTNPGGTGREVCEPSRGDVCKAGRTMYTKVAVDKATGDVYAVGGSRIDKFSGDGEWLRAFGFDTVRFGPNESDVDEVQKLTVKATGGTFTLSTYHNFEEFPFQKVSAPIPYNATAAQVEAAINAMNGFGTSAGGSVSVTGGPGDATGTSPYEITFGGVYAGDDISTLEVDPTNLTGPERDAVNVVTQQGGEAEVCTPADVCNNGFTERKDAGSFFPFRMGMTVAPPGAPNAGNVLISEGNARVQEFGSDGSFIRMFGWDVDADDPSTGFEFCVAGEKCKPGLLGHALGQFGEHIDSIAVDPAGAIYVVDGLSGGGGNSPDPGLVNYRVQKFTPSGETLIPSVFGESEVQEATVKAAAGSFRLGVVVPRGVEGQASMCCDERVITNVSISKGTPEVGMPFSNGSGTPNWVEKIDGTTWTLTNGAQTCCFNSFTLPSIEYTPDLPAGATAAEVETALNGLSRIKDRGGSVTVTGGPGDAGGTTPYVVAFSGGKFAQTDQAPLHWAQGSTALSGGTGAGADQVAITTTQEGGPNSPDWSDDADGESDEGSPLDIEISLDGSEIAITKNYQTGSDRCEDGKLSSAETRLQVYSSSGERIATSKPCAGLPVFRTSSEAEYPISINDSTGSPYVLQRSGFAGTRVLLFGDAGTKPTVALDEVSNISPTGATVSGTINPNGPGDVLAANPASTTYRVEYKRTDEAEWEVYAPDVSVGSGTSPVPFTVGISGLTPKAEYEARVIAIKPFGFNQVVLTTPPFTTLAAKPVITALSSSEVTVSSAVLHASINPLGTATSYHFEYSEDFDYGFSTPEVEIGDSLAPVDVEQTITGLNPSVYNFRVVATNALGTTVSSSQTFNFYPENCPNDLVRQQTGASRLPDCRAYELVSPANAGSATLLPGGPPSGYASHPPRFSFIAGLGAIPGPWNPPNAFGDHYVATRTNSGWQTRYVGISGEVAGAMTGPPNGEGDPIGGSAAGVLRGGIMGSLALDKFIGWNPGQQGFSCCGLTGSMVPFAFDAAGNSLGRWPLQAADVPGALKDISCGANATVVPCGPEGGHIGDVRPSADFSHYFFSSGNVAFLPGGQTSGIGSVYDYDTVTGELTIASVLDNGDPIQKEPGVGGDDYMALPAASEDGSRVLMAASGTGISGKGTNSPMPFPCGFSGAGNGSTIENCPPLPPSHLYMRAADLDKTYDVSQGHLVDFKGMTSDGSKVFFTTAEQLQGDTDEGVDLYMWSEATDDITRVSQALGSVGDSDACNTAWIKKCGIEVALPAPPPFLEPGQNFVNDFIDRDGGVYFYSPEQFVGSDGLPGRRNLYFAKDDPGDPDGDFTDPGEIEYVATMNGDAPASRFQVSDDGSWAAFITTSKLTPYDNQGKAEMYRFNTDIADLTCVSCLPNDDPPQHDVEGSQNGLYLSNDGRAFFATSDALVAADTNNLRDVYEYVSGRPQLISTGIAGRDETVAKTGLVGVSADGLDAYFSTVETLVAQDQNGAFLKFYDARVYGGFPTGAVTAPCAAADECHGKTTPQSTPPVLGSTADLGDKGNATGKRTKKKACAKKKKGKAKKRPAHCGKKKKKRGSRRGR